MTVFGKFKQKFSLVTPMGKMPDMSRNVMTFRSCHPRLPISAILGPKKPLLACFKPSFCLHVLCYQMLGLARPQYIALLQLTSAITHRKRASELGFEVDWNVNLSRQLARGLEVGVHGFVGFISYLV